MIAPKLIVGAPICGPQIKHLGPLTVLTGAEGEADEASCVRECSGAWRASDVDLDLAVLELFSGDNREHVCVRTRSRRCRHELDRPPAPVVDDGGATVQDVRESD